MIKIPEEIKQLFLSDSIKKNIRIIFPGGELPDITNNNLIAESFSFSESACSKNKLKFGLCEANVVKFETFGIPNIKGLEIDVYHEIDISSLEADFINQHGLRDNILPYPFYRIPYGRFVVDSCEKQNDMNRRKVIAYTKEILWDTIPNPLEKAKFNGTLDIQKDYYYRFNVEAVAISNVFFNECEQFMDKTAVGNISDTRVMQYIGRQDAFMAVDLTCKTIELADMDRDMLYYLRRPDAVNVSEFIDRINEISGDITRQYQLIRGQSVKPEQMKDLIKYGFFIGYHYDPNSEMYMQKFIILDDHTYYYPHIGIDADDALRRQDNYRIKLCVPVKGTIITTRYAGDYGETRGVFEFRNEAEEFIYRINSLQDLYIEMARKEIKSENGTAYRADDSKIDIRKLVEGYAELNGYFGRHTRSGGV